MKEVFGEDYKKAEWYKSLLRTKGFFITLGTFLGYIGDGFMDIFNFITGYLVDENNEPVGRLKFLIDNIGFFYFHALQLEIIFYYQKLELLACSLICHSQDMQLMNDVV